MAYDGLKRLALLQIGDFHYPDASKALLGDIKDKEFPIGMIEACSPRPLQNAVREVLRVSTKNTIDATLLCGDLTSYGKADGYRECVEYILSNGIIDGKAQEHVHVVPGNHDVIRDVCDETGNDLLSKFEPLRKAWMDRGYSIFPWDYSRVTTVSSADGMSARVYSANSCIGCGVLREFPPAIRPYLRRALAKAKLSGKPKDIFRVSGEILDTPMFEWNDFSDNCSDIQALPQDILPVIVAHHNVLPQAENRFAPYTELINGGQVRCSLTACGKPILYLHGHIHSDPIEIVEDPANKGSRLVCISAPELIKGFNLVFIEYGRSKVPLGIIVVPFRSKQGGNIVRGNETRIHLHTGPTLRKLCDTDTRLIVSQLKRSTRFGEVLDTGRAQLSRNVQQPTIASMLLEAEWFGLITIYGKTNPEEYGRSMRDYEGWTVERLL